MKTILASSVLLAALVSQGCSDAPTKRPDSSSGSQSQNAPAPPAPVAPPPTSSPAATATAPAPSAAASANAGGAAGSKKAFLAPGEEPDTEVARAGVGAKGRGYGGGIITAPIAAKFTIEQRLVFEVSIPGAMNFYRADHNNQGPKTHAEFMRNIIEANNIQLPELPAGDSYLFDPKTQELMVAHPKK